MSPWVKVKLGAAAAGFGAGLAGMVLQARPLVWVGIGLLGLAFVLRLVERRTIERDEPTIRG